MRNLSLVIILFWLSATMLLAQNTQSNSTAKSKESIEIGYGERPKLVVGIVVDQMRYDYLTRFYDRYGKGGFKRMIEGGYNCKNNHFNYVPTYTGPGHASIFTGSTPEYHGIIGNNWYDKEIKQTVYCVSDSSVSAVGTTGYNGEMSPHRLKSTTFADENRLFTQMRGKTIGISLKDRGSIIPAGHTANAAYWFQGGSEGNWVSSSYYMKNLPSWVQNFNDSDAMESYLKPWNLLYDIDTYTASGDDKNDYEYILSGRETSEFPYDVMKLQPTNGQMGYIRSTPYGNSLTVDFAIKALTNEQLGKDKFTDVLTVSFSSTDYIGHSFGVNSKEIEDTYLRLDQDLERLLNALDKQVGKGEYLAFLTSDHGAIDVPGYLMANRIPAGYFNDTEFNEKLNNFLLTTYGSDQLVENISNNQIFINSNELKHLKLVSTEVQEAIMNEIINYEFIDRVYSRSTMSTTEFSSGVEMLIQNGFHQKRSGDVIFVYDPNYLSYPNTGSSHGSAFNYDTHVPLIFFGKGIKKGSTYERTEIIDIAPTISAMLGISYPNTSTGKPLGFIIAK